MSSDTDAPYLTSHDLRIMRGLRQVGHAYVPAGDVEATAALEALGYVTTWDTVGGFGAARLTRAGLERLERVFGTPASEPVSKPHPATGLSKLIIDTVRRARARGVLK